ncbi:MAG: hypothetical protein GYB33_00575 [Gammaproteobacteria bacterium]|nr:hypothetical protein [Gammaproteobacteria bacterium]
MAIHLTLKKRSGCILASGGLLYSLLLASSGAVAWDESARLPDILAPPSAAKGPYLPDFSYAGYSNGLVDIPVGGGTVINVRDSGAIPDDGKDDSKAILNAIATANATAGPVTLRFEAGRYQLTEVLRIERSNLVMQGAGSGNGGTTLYFPRPLDQVDKSTSLDELRKYLVKENKFQREPDKNINELFTEYSWSGGLIWVQKPGTRPASYLNEYDSKEKPLLQIQSGQRGSQTLAIAATANLKPGDVVQIQWLNRDGPEAGIIKSLYGAEYKSAGRHHWGFPERPLVRQSTKITSVSNDKLTIADPLLHDINDTLPAQVAEWEHLQHVGIEDLRIEFPNSPFFGHHLERGYNGIYFTSAYDSWVRNVRITNADSGLLSYNSANVTFRNIITDGERRAHYGVHMGNVHNVLAENIVVMNPVLHSLSFNTQSTKCVYKDAQVFSTPALDQHSGANHQNLYDNVSLYMTATHTKDGPVVAVYDGGGAPYWQPGHGAYNTTWNLRVIIVGGAYPDEVVTLEGLTEGPLANIVGLHGNRKFKLDYRPAPYVEKLNTELRSVPSLYAYQLAKRLVSDE